MTEIPLQEILNHKIKDNRNYLSGGFYMIENKINGKRYIGKSINYMSRLKQHTYKSKSKTIIDSELKKGLHDFRFYLISTYLELDINFFNRRKETEIEQSLITENKTDYPNGYNVRCYGWI